MDKTTLQSLGLWEPLGFRWTREQSRRVFRWILRRWCGITFHGQERIQHLSQCILAPTHFSHLDFWAVLEGLAPALREKVYIAAAEDFFYRPLWRKWITQLVSYHNFPFERQRVSLTGYHQLQRILEQGFSLLIFAQGSRSRDTNLLPFKPMVSMLAVETGVPLVPVRIEGALAALPPGRKWPRRFPLTVLFGDPIVTPKSTGRLHDATKAVNQELMQRIQRLGGVFSGPED